MLTVVIDGRSHRQLSISWSSLNFNRTANYKPKNHTYQNILLDYVQQLANYIFGKRKDLHLIIPPVKIHRSDPLELQKKILAISSDERKRLDINKSTLWYQWKHLNEGKCMYDLHHAARHQDSRFRETVVAIQERALYAHMFSCLHSIF